jgi:hypothetical protein
MAVGYATATIALDPQGTATLLEAETNISAAEALGTVGEASVSPIVASEVLSQPNKVVFKITGTAAIDITNAIAAVAGLEAASGYPAPA